MARLWCARVCALIFVQFDSIQFHSNQFYSIPFHFIPFHSSLFDPIQLNSSHRRRRRRRPLLLLLLLLLLSIGQLSSTILARPSVRPPVPALIADPMTADERNRQLHNRPLSGCLPSGRAMLDSTSSRRLLRTCAQGNWLPAADDNNNSPARDQMDCTNTSSRVKTARLGGLYIRMPAHRLKLAANK